MSERPQASTIKERILRLMKVPPEPYPPAGGEGSTRVFRASKQFYLLNLLRWAFQQVLTFVGILLALGFLGAIDHGEDKIRDLAIEQTQGDAAKRSVVRKLGEHLDKEGGFVLGLFHLAEAAGLGIFVLQLPVTFMLVRLDYEMRWYIVTDRSLRIREGIWRVNELTLTFANVQEVAIRQGPLQRVFGISNLRVRTAGGGASQHSGKSQHEKDAKSGHVGYFRGVDNAESIRDLVLEQLRRLRDSGLGDPDQPADAATIEDRVAAGELLPAARELLAEMRALRQNI